VRNGVFDSNLFTSRGMALIDPLFLVRSLPNAGLCGISIQFGIHGRNTNIMNGSISGLQAIGTAAAEIREGAVDQAIAGGYDSLLQLEPAIGQIIAGNIGVASELNGSAQHEQTGSGYVLGEGAGFLVLEREDHALRRKARIYGEIVSEAQGANANGGAKTATDAFENVALRALGGGNAEERSLDMVFGDGLGLPSHDALEAEVLRRLSSSQPLLFSAGTAAHGFCGVANSVFSSIHGLLTIYSKKRPPTWNWPWTPNSSATKIAGRDRAKIQRVLIWCNDAGIKSAAIVVQKYQ
jgi:3-oxoacyl-[acyl-carrier-protein] synthase II